MVTQKLGLNKHKWIEGELNSLDETKKEFLWYSQCNGPYTYIMKFGDKCYTLNVLLQLTDKLECDFLWKVWDTPIGKSAKARNLMLNIKGLRQSPQQCNV